MKKKVFNIMALTLVSTMALSLNAFAFDTGTGTVKVPTSQKMVTAKKGIKRSGNYSYVMTKANSVYPVQEGKKDTYTRCYARWYTSDGKAMTSKVQLTEGNLKKVTVYDGYIGKTGVTLKFSGNDPALDAYVSYYYNGK